MAGPLAGSLLAELGAEVIKVEPPGGDAYRRVMPVAPGIGRYFVPLNRGKRSVVLDLKSAAGRAALARLVATADVVVHNAPPARAEAFGLALGDSCTPRIRRSSSASSPRSARTARSPGRPRTTWWRRADPACSPRTPPTATRVPVRAGGIPMADLTAGHLLATGVLAALVRARTTGEGTLVEVSLLGAALAVQIQDLVWLDGEAAGPAAAATRGDLIATGRRDRGRPGDEPVLPLLRGRRRLPRGRVPQSRATGGVPRALRSRRSDDCDARSRAGGSGGARARSGV